MINSYEYAGSILDKLYYATDSKYFKSKSYLDGKYNEYQNKYSIERAQKFESQEVLTYFFDIAKTNEYFESYLYFLIHGEFGSISSGYTSFYPLHYVRNAKKGEQNGWRIYGKKANTYAEAVDFGKKFINKLAICVNDVKYHPLNSIQDYERFQKIMDENLQDFSNHIWIHKYLHILYPDYFSQFHSLMWKQQLLCAFGIEPKDSFYGMAGQIQEIKTKSKIENYSDFAETVYKWFPELGNMVFRLNVQDSSKINFKNGERIVLNDSLLSDFSTLINSKKFSEGFSDKKNPIFVIADISGNVYGLITKIEKKIIDNKGQFTGFWNNCFNNDILPNKNDGIKSGKIISDFNNLAFIYNHLYPYFDEKWSPEKDDIMHHSDKEGKTIRLNIEKMEYHPDKDAQYVTEVNDYDLKDIQGVEYTPIKVKPLPKNTYSKSEKYARDQRNGAIALKRANYLCEFDSNHKTFIKDRDGTQYMEAHHIIPMAYQGLFKDASLDVPANIVSLCCNCHRFIHYGNKKERTIALKLLYDMRINELKAAGIDISFKELVEMYF